jgi:cation diffusion facilitator family transporter
LYNSIAIISDALNSFTDIIASLVVHISIIVSYQRPDSGHQFGHKRAQPIAGLIVAIFTGIVGFEVITASIRRLLDGQTAQQGIPPIVITFVVIIIKAALYVYTKIIYNKTKSTALLASSIDHRNDMLISFTVLIGVIATFFGYPILDPIVAVIIGIWIIKSGFDIGMDNIKYLMGVPPSENLFEKIEEHAKSVPGVIGLNDVRAHYVGTQIEAEVHIYVNNKLNIRKAHDLGKVVQKKVEGIPDISRAFIHIDPFNGKFIRKRKFKT